MNSKGKNAFKIGLAVFLIGAIFPAISIAASVSAECAYTDADLVCYIYVDTSPDSLISGGVRLTYNTDELSNPLAVKNETAWFFGGGVAEYAYMDPDTTTSGEVILIVGKLDSDAPTAGVTGTRVQVGKVTFDRATSDVPVADPGATFGIALGLGRIAPYVNFVNTAGDPLDDPTDTIFLTPVNVERGDSNASGSITSRDLTALRSLLRSGSDYVVYADCNGSGTLTSRDLTCIRAILRR